MSEKPLTDAEIDEILTAACMDKYEFRALIAQAKEANTLRASFEALEGASLTGLMDDLATLRAQLEAKDELLKAASVCIEAEREYTAFKGTDKSQHYNYLADNAYDAYAKLKGQTQ